MRILGLDPAKLCGWCWSDGADRKYGVWDLSGGAGEQRGAVLDRLIAFIADIGKAYGVDLIAFEEASKGSHNPAVQAQHNELAGAIEWAAFKFGVPTRRINPMTLKKFATGDGRAPKPQLIAAAKTHYGIITASSDVADAVFVCELARQDQRKAETMKRARPIVRRVKEPRLF